MYLVSFDFSCPSKCGSYFCSTLYLQFARRRYKFFNIEVSEDASKYVHCQRTSWSILIHISHNLSFFWKLKNQSKTLSQRLVLGKSQVKDNRKDRHRTGVSTDTRTKRDEVLEKSLKRINCGLHCPCWLQVSYASYDIWHLLYAPCNTESTCVLPIILLLIITQN